MPRKSGGAENLRRGDRVQVKLNSCYRHFLNGLVGTVTCVLNHGVIVELDNDPSRRQKVLGAPQGRGQNQTIGVVGPQVPGAFPRQFQFNEVVRISP